MELSKSSFVLCSFDSACVPNVSIDDYLEDTAPKYTRVIEDPSCSQIKCKSRTLSIIEHENPIEF